MASFLTRERIERDYEAMRRGDERHFERDADRWTRRTPPVVEAPPQTYRCAFCDEFHPRHHVCDAELAHWERLTTREG